ncbi:MaoC family dehydratase [Ferrovibrio sp.]|uniref:MaoC family dehydratase n=1 Tax=Ferrovibrio sp. TaxID=1917215 RepID=UPI001B44489F|nr:MaoC family dehydratase [Ferrovibrio sp.]MBP7064667.1 MaoC family dehydratase [Ferrovibrio sp.]
MKYFDDFKVGDTTEFPPRSVTEAEIIAFARDYDPQPFHIDPEAAAKTPYGGIIASGWHTAGIMMRLMVDHAIRGSTSMGSPGVDELRWLKPVRPGDTLSLIGVVTAVKASTSKPDRGVVKTQYEMRNQHGDVVLRMRGNGMYRRHPDVAAAAAKEA